MPRSHQRLSAQAVDSRRNALSAHHQVSSLMASISLSMAARLLSLLGLWLEQ